MQDKMTAPNGTSRTNKLPEEMVRTSELRRRLLKQLERADTLYWKWQDRPPVGDGEENAGTNPI